MDTDERKIPDVVSAMEDAIVRHQSGLTFAGRQRVSRIGNDRPVRDCRDSRHARRRTSVGAVRPFGLDEYGDTALLGHDAVVHFPVVMGAAGGGEDVA